MDKKRFAPLLSTGKVYRITECKRGILIESFKEEKRTCHLIENGICSCVTYRRYCHHLALLKMELVGSGASDLYVKSILGEINLSIPENNEVIYSCKITGKGSNFLVFSNKKVVIYLLGIE